LRTVVERAETAEIGYGRQALRILLISTDETYREDIKIDVPALSADLQSKNIYPVFLVTTNLVSYYENFVSELGIGDVVGMNSDSSDILAAITNAFADYKVDFIENLIGTDHFDTLTGNSLDNTIEGNGSDDTIKGLGGNDILKGGEGEDVAVFRGLKSDYTITNIDDGGIRVQDNVANRDGTDDLFDIEYLRFEQEPSGTDDTPTAEYVPEPQGLVDAEDFFEDRYYRTFLDLSWASYAAKERLLNGIEFKNNGAEVDIYQKFANPNDGHYDGFRFLTSEELNLTSWGFPGISYYEYNNGFYLGDSAPGNSMATVGRTKDALFITFQGTNEKISDIIDDLFLMSVHYLRFQPLLRAIDIFLESHDDINKVYVSGHSLGGKMAEMYMQDHKNDPRFTAVTFEAAVKGNIVEEYDGRFTNFEMRGDWVPDALGKNYGRTIHLEYEDHDGIHNFPKSHSLETISKYFDQAVINIKPDFIGWNEQIYVDTDWDDVITTNSPSYKKSFGRKWRRCRSRCRTYFCRKLCR